MEPAIILALLVVGLVIWIGGSWAFAAATGQLKQAYKSGYDSVMQPHIANQIANGAKPWGKPLAGSTYGGAYFMSTQQLLARNLATPIDALRADLPYLGGHVTETKAGNSISASMDTRD